MIFNKSIELKIFVGVVGIDVAGDEGHLEDNQHAKFDQVKE